VTILQSYEQGITVWGEHGMATRGGAATKKIIGAGVDSPRLARDLATLVGQHDVPVRTLSSRDGRASDSAPLRRPDPPPGTPARAPPTSPTRCRPPRNRSASGQSGPTPRSPPCPPQPSRSRNDHRP